MNPSTHSPYRHAHTALAMLAALCVGVASAQVAPVSVAPPQVPALVLPFQDFFRTPIGPKGLEMSNKLRQVNGQPVRLVGYMVQQDGGTPGQFLLTPRPVQMSEHADGEADDLPAATVLVYLDNGALDWTIPYKRGLVEVSGELQVGRHEAPDGRIFWVRLRLTPPALHANAMAKHL